MRSPRHSLSRRAAAIGCLAVLLATTAPAASALPEPSASPPSPAAAAAGTEVTLVTGDTVTIGPEVAGEPAVTMEPAEGAGESASFTTLRSEGDVYVVPDRITRLVPRVLDLELFNVTALAEMGYDDKSTDALPLIVRGPRPSAAVSARESRPLPSIDAVAMSVPKDAAAGFADELAAPPGPRAAGVTKVWLDRRVEADELDWNLGIIGAPEVWGSGLSGAGIDVAVLDSGVDADHPDLSGQVAAERNFTDEDSAADGDGHGTHVASIIAGTGAAADGARRGVAHGARLLSGKVLDNTGSGQASWVIAGMEWAAEQGAEVANLSLGASPALGDDPVAQALDALTADTGTLYVAAAGNSGPWGSSVATPGVAESALTVGAAGTLGGAVRSSGVGPTRGTHRAKPDLIAPGVGITGARAGGGTTDPYTQMNGTSQATPHVAGAAALLMQQHPDWDWRRVKTTLMTTADADPQDLRPLSQGAGLLDLPDAATDTLQFSRGNVDFGYRRYPDGTRPASMELTLTNTGDEPERLSLSDYQDDIYGDRAPDDLVTVAPGELTVAPGATERVTVTLTPEKADPRVYAGALVLDREGHETVTLPISSYLEPPRHDIRLTVLDRRGEPWAGGSVWLGNMETKSPASGGGFQIVQLDENGQGTARMLPGPISILTQVPTPSADGSPPSLSVAGDPEVTVDEDISFTIDARKARQLDPATVQGRRTDLTHASIHYRRSDAADTGGISDSIYATPEDIEEGRVFLTPTEPVQRGEMAFESRWRLDARDGTHGRQADVYELVLGAGGVIPGPGSPAYRVTRAEARKLARLESDYRSLQGKPDVYEEWRALFTGKILSSYAIPEPIEVPQRRVEMVTARPDMRWRHCLIGPAGVDAELCAPTTTYEPGERLSPVWFRGTTPAMIAGTHYRDSIALPTHHLSDGEHKGPLWNTGLLGNETLRLFRDGTELPRRPGTTYFDSPPEPGMFRLEHTSSPDQDVLPIGRRTQTSWTFPSQGPDTPGGGSTTPRLLAVDYQPDTDARGTLDAWSPLAIRARLVSTDGATAPIRTESGELRLWLSTDHGGTWHRARVITSGDDGVVSARVPGRILRPGQEVSVRASGSAAEGRGIEQTIIDAYPVR